MKRLSFTSLGLCLLIILGSVLPVVTQVQKAHALTGSQFQAGRIIDDEVFYNPYAMTFEGVQAFLNSKVPVCDNHHGGGNYTCLKDYGVDTPGYPYEAGLCNQLFGGWRSAAQIIYDVSQSCGINPQAMIVLLQKEQAIITDTWPTDYQYKFATGFCVYDTVAPPECDGTDGFFNQIYYAARQFKKYAKSPTSYSYRAGRNNNIYYSPHSSCGSSSVYIQNQATAGLYNYTPYQPSQAALDNLYGVAPGDPNVEGTDAYCAAYGNRNFWRLFNDWFGAGYYDPAKDYDSDNVLNKFDFCKTVKGITLRWGCPPTTPYENGGYSGDFNGDGYGDVLVFSEFPDGHTFNLWLFPGSSTGLQAPVFQRTLGPNNGGWDFARSKAVAVNVNGDGYMDLVIFHQGPSNEIVRHVLKGSASGIQASDEAWVGWQYPSQGWLWSNIRLVGGADFNGDGYGDVLAFSVDPDGVGYNIYTFNGSANGLQAPVFQRSLGAANGGWDFSKSKPVIVNVNGDAYADLVVFHQGSGNEIVRSILKGSASGIQASDEAWVGWQTPAQGWSWTNLRLAGIGDFNGDGYGDVAAFSIFPDEKTYNLWLYTGSSTGLQDPTFQRTMGPDNGGWDINKTKPLAVGVNGDVYMDLVIFHQGPSNEIVRHVLKGSPSGIQASDESWVQWQFPSQGWLWTNVRMIGGGN